MNVSKIVALNYQHQFIDGSICDLPVGKAVCVGRNYAAHAFELNNPVPVTPLLFIKPSTSFASLAPGFVIPADTPCHHELEIALLIGKRLTSASAPEIEAAIVGVTLALDLTLRDRQQALKENGQPWELAKAFDGALPIAPFIAPAQLPALNELQFSLEVNGQQRQTGMTADMLTKPIALIEYLTRYFTLSPGDVVLTGTPAGVAALRSGDQLRLNLQDQFIFETSVV